MAKTAVNSAMKPMSLAWLWIVASTAMAAVGRRQATTVVTKEVNLRMRLRRYVEMVGQLLEAFPESEPCEEREDRRRIVPERFEDHLTRVKVTVEIDKRLAFFSLLVVWSAFSVYVVSVSLRLCQKGSQSLAIH